MTSARRHAFPTVVFLLVVGTVCIGLAVTAWYSYSTLSRLRMDYLNNLARDVASGLDAQVRGPGMRNNPAYWQSTIEQALQDHDSLAFIVVVNQSGQVIAARGNVPESEFSARVGFTGANGIDVYIVELPLATPRQQGMMGMGRLAAPTLIRLGMFASSADFLRKQAVVQVVVNILAIVSLLSLAFYFLRTLDRFVELQARQHSERRLRALGTMAATLAHEIRNPLGAIKGLTQLVQEELPREHQAQQLTGTVVSEAERLERLVTDLLTFSRPYQPEFSVIDFKHLLSEIRSMLRTRLESAGLTVEINCEGETTGIVTDESGLKQVLLNVILNALDVTPRGKAVTVKAARPKHSRTLRVEIDDVGPGIGERDPEELFQPFTTTKAQGTGLGLAVSREVIERLGGTIELANRSGGGARATITIPVAQNVSRGRTSASQGAR